MKYYMSYTVKYNGKTFHKKIPDVAYTTITKVVRLLLLQGVDHVDICPYKHTKPEEFKGIMNDIRLTYLENSIYKMVPSYDGMDSTNPYFFHIPDVDNSTISIYESPEYMRFKLHPIDEVIGRMTKNEVLINEMFNDEFGLHGIESYEKLRKQYAEDIEYTKDYVNSQS